MNDPILIDTITPLRITSKQTQEYFTKLYASNVIFMPISDMLRPPTDYIGSPASNTSEHLGSVEVQSYINKRNVKTQGSLAGNQTQGSWFELCCSQ